MLILLYITYSCLGEEGFPMLGEYSRESPHTVDNLLLIRLHLPLVVSWKNTARGGTWEDEA